MPAAAMMMKKPVINFTQKSQYAKKAEAEDDQSGASGATDWFDTSEGIAYLKSIFDKDDHDMSKQKLYTLEEFDKAMQAHIAEMHKKFKIN